MNIENNRNYKSINQLGLCDQNKLKLPELSRNTIQAEQQKKLSRNNSHKSIFDKQQTSFTKLQSDYTAILSQINTFKNSSEQNKNILPEKIIQKMLICFEQALVINVSTVEHFLLILSIVLNIWKISSEKQENRIKIVSHSIKQLQKLTLPSSYSTVTKALLSLKNQYKNLIDLLSSQDSKQDDIKIRKKMQERFLLFLIICVKQFYHENNLQDGYALLVEMYEMFNIAKSEKKRKIKYQNKEQLSKNAQQYEQNMNGSEIQVNVNNQLKFKVHYLMHKVTSRLNKSEAQLKAVEQCLRILGDSTIFNQKNKSKNYDNAEDKSQLRAKLQIRKIELSKNKNSPKKQLKIKKKSSLNNSRAKELNQSNKLLQQAEQQQQTFKRRLVRSTDKGFRNRSLSQNNKDGKALLDFQTTKKDNKFTANHQNINAIKTVSKSFFKKADAKKNLILKDTKDQGRTNEKQIKIKKVNKKSLYKSTNKELFNDKFTNCLQKLQQDLQLQPLNQQQPLFNTKIFEHMLLLRPNETLKHQKSQKQKEKQINFDLNDETHTQFCMKQSLNINQNYTDHHNLDSIQLSKNLEHSQLPQPNHKQKLIMQAVSYIQNDMLNKFVNGYQRMKKKRKNLYNYKYEGREMSSEKSCGYSDYDQSMEDNNSQKFFEFQSASTHNKEHIQEKVLYFLDDNIIENVWFPVLGLVNIMVELKTKKKGGREKNKQKINFVDFYQGSIVNYMLQVKIESEFYGKMFAQFQIPELAVEDGLSLEQKLLRKLQQNNAVIEQQLIQRDEDIQKTLLFILIKNTLKAYNKGLGYTLSYQPEDNNQCAKITKQRYEKLYHLHIYQEYKKSLDIIKSASLRSSYYNSTHHSHSAPVVENKKFYYLKLSKKAVRNQGIGTFLIPIIKHLFVDCSLMPKYKLKTITTDREDSLEPKQTSIQDSGNILHGEDLYLPVLIHRISTQTAYVSKIIEPSLHCDRISLFFMTHQPHFMLNQFFSSMKFIIITKSVNNQIVDKFFNVCQYSYIFRLQNNKDYIVHLSYYQTKPLYTSRQGLYFLKLQFQEKNHRIRSDKLLLTSYDVDAWSILDLDDNHKEVCLKQKLYQSLLSFIGKITIRKSRNYLQFGLTYQIQEPQIETNPQLPQIQAQKNIPTFPSIKNDYFFSNCFKQTTITNLQSTQNFLSPYLNSIKILYKKSLKIQCFKTYGILTVLKCNELIFDFIIYVPSTQNHLGFSLTKALLDNIIQKDDEHYNWDKIIKYMQFHIKGTKQRVYYAVKILNNQIFVKDNIFVDYFTINNRTFKIQAAIQEKKGSLNFWNHRNKNKRKVKRLPDFQDNKKQRVTFSKIYESQSSKYMIYLSIKDSETQKSINISYYLHEVLKLVITRQQNNKKQDNSDQRISTIAHQFNQKIIQYSDLSHIFRIISNSYIMQLQENSNIFMNEPDKADKVENMHKKKGNIFNSGQLQTILHRQVLQKFRKQAESQRTKNSYKLNLNSLISKNRQFSTQQNYDHIIYLYKGLQSKKKDNPINCIMYNPFSSKFVLATDHYRYGRLKIMEISAKLHPMAHMEIIVKNRNVLLGARNRLSNYWENVMMACSKF